MQAPPQKINARNRKRLGLNPPDDMSLFLNPEWQEDSSGRTGKSTKEAEKEQVKGSGPLFVSLATPKQGPNRRPGPTERPGLKRETGVAPNEKSGARQAGSPPPWP